MAAPIPRQTTNHVQVSSRVLSQPPPDSCGRRSCCSSALDSSGLKTLNIEAYPNPTPVILEITAQAPGLSAEEMERYYTIPMEIGLYTTPGHRCHPLDFVLRIVLCSRQLQIWCGL